MSTGNGLDPEEIAVMRAQINAVKISSDSRNGTHAIQTDHEGSRLRIESYKVYTAGITCCVKTLFQSLRDDNGKTTWTDEYPYVTLSQPRIMKQLSIVSLCEG